MVDVERTEVRRLATRPAVGAEGVSWSPDGQFIAYVGLPDGTALPETDNADPLTPSRRSTSSSSEPMGPAIGM